MLQLFFALLYFAQPADLPLVIEVENLRSGKGQLFVEVYNSEDGFPGEPEKAFKRFRFPLKSDKANMKVQLPPGRYAFVVHHDENGNGKMDSNFIGMPKEGVAASNKAKGFMGPPSFEDAVFELKGQNTRQVVEMSYL